MAPHRIRILYVDDDVQSLGRHAGVLDENYGFDVYTATDVESGREYLAERTPDCVLCGLRVTAGDGREFLEWVGENYPNLPFVLLTSETSKEAIERAVHAGVTDCVFEFTVNISYELLALRLRLAVAASDPDGDGSEAAVDESEEPTTERQTGEGANGDSSRESLIEVVKKALDDRRPEGPSDRRRGETGPETGPRPGVEFQESADTGHSGGVRGRAAADRGAADATEPTSGPDSGIEVEPPDWWEFDPEAFQTSDADRTDLGDRWSWREPDRSIEIDLNGSEKRDQSPTDVEAPTGTGEDPLREIGSQSGVREAGNGHLDDSETRDLEDVPREELVGMAEKLIDDEGGGDGESTDRTEDSTPGETTESGETPSRATVDTEEAVDTSGIDGPVSEVGSADESDREPGGAGRESEFGEHGVSADGASEGKAGAVRENTGGTETEPRGDDVEGLIEPGDYSTPDDLDLKPGTNVVVQCSSHDERRHAACVDLLGVNGDSRTDVLLIRYKRMSESRLERIATDANRVKVVSIGYSQPIPASVQENVNQIKINDPNDVTRLGIVVSGTMDDWGPSGGDIVVCYDSLNVLLRYKNTRSTFRFLHVFLNKLQSTGAVSHFHVDPTAGDPQDINTLKPLFDASMSIDSVGTHLETQ